MWARQTCFKTGRRWLLYRTYNVYDSYTGRTTCTTLIQDVQRVWLLYGTYKVYDSHTRHTMCTTLKQDVRRGAEEALQPCGQLVMSGRPAGRPIQHLSFKQWSVIKWWLKKISDQWSADTTFENCVSIQGMISGYNVGRSMQHLRIRIFPLYTSKFDNTLLYWTSMVGRYNIWGSCFKEWSVTTAFEKYREWCKVTTIYRDGQLSDTTTLSVFTK